MSIEGPDVLDLVVNFLSVNWQSKHVTIGLFEALKTIGQAFLLKNQPLLNFFGLTKKIITYVKNKGINLNITIAVIKIVMFWV